jgi:hypothetical protein
MNTSPISIIPTAHWSTEPEKKIHANLDKLDGVSDTL